MANFKIAPCKTGYGRLLRLLLPVNRFAKDKVPGAASAEAKINCWNNYKLPLKALRLHQDCSPRVFFEWSSRTDTLTSVVFDRFCESRLDRILIKLPYYTSLGQVRQAISHGQVRVNFRKVTCKSYVVMHGDLLQLVIQDTVSLTGHHADAAPRLIRIFPNQAKQLFASKMLVPRDKSAADVVIHSTDFVSQQNSLQISVANKRLINILLLYTPFTRKLNYIE